MQPRSQGICSWGAKYPGMAWSRDPRILRKMAYCLLGSGSEYILSQLIRSLYKYKQYPLNLQRNREKNCN
jgi:hypothetical protein